MRREIENRFNGWIKWKFESRPEVVKYLLGQERKQMVIDNLLREIKKCEIKLPKFDAKKCAMIIDDSARVFSERALKWAEERLVSDLEKQRAIDEAGKLDEFEAEQEELKKEFSKDKVQVGKYQVVKSGDNQI